MSDPYTDQAKVLASLSAENGLLRVEIERLKAKHDERYCAWLKAEGIIGDLRTEIARLRATARSVVNYHLRGAGSLSPARDPVVLSRLIDELATALEGK